MSDRIERELPYPDSSHRMMVTHLVCDPGSARILVALLNEYRDEGSTPDRRRVAGELLILWIDLVLPDYRRLERDPGAL